MSSSDIVESFLKMLNLSLIVFFRRLVICFYVAITSAPLNLIEENCTATTMIR